MGAGGELALQGVKVISVAPKIEPYLHGRAAKRIDRDTGRQRTEKKRPWRSRLGMHSKGARAKEKEGQNDPTYSTSEKKKRTDNTVNAKSEPMKDGVKPPDQWARKKARWPPAKNV